MLVQSQYAARVDSAVVPDLNAFLVSLTHLPTEVQIDLLRQATKQISEVVEQSLSTIEYKEQL